MGVDVVTYISTVEMDREALHIKVERKSVDAPGWIFICGLLDLFLIHAQSINNSVCPLTLVDLYSWCQAVVGG